MSFIDGIAGLTLQLTDLLAEMRKEQEELLTNPDITELMAATLQADSVNISNRALVRSQNIMSGNFAGGSPEDNQYIDAWLTGAETQVSLQNSMNKTLGSVLDAIAETAFWHGDPKMRQAKMMKDSIESNATVFSDIKSNVEKQADEAMARKDENGDPIEQPATTTASFTNDISTDVVPDVAIDVKAAAVSILPSISIDV